MTEHDNNSRNVEEIIEELMQDETNQVQDEATELAEDKTALEHEEAPETCQDDEKQEGKLFKKKEKPDKKHDKLKEKVNELEDKVMRQMAEFENFRKRSEKEKAAMFETGAKSVIEKILPVVDNFERGFATVTDEEKTSPFVEGMERVFKQLTAALEEAGVKQIEAVGKEFDPNFHNAVMHVDDEEAGDNVVIEEFQKGYMYRESVVRHSMVKVAN